jgi:hypothetical protein
MTLKEKFGELYVEKGMANECEKIADDFAIGFAEWIRNMSFGKYHAHSTKELLEIYKKEKGL